MKTKFICKCECGGNVRGVTESFGRLWTYCTKCTPVQKVDLSKLRPKRKKKGGDK